MPTRSTTAKNIVLFIRSKLYNGMGVHNEQQAREEYCTGEALLNQSNRGWALRGREIIIFDSNN
jgi:hypothetical protein